jgi:hypothetical protein
VDATLRESHGGNRKRQASNNLKGESMLRRGVIAALVAVSVAVVVPIASADPINAKHSTLVTAMCGTQQVQVVVNGNGHFGAAHVVGGTSTFVPSALDLTFSFTPTGGPTETMTQDIAKTGSHANEVTCDIPAALNTVTSPEGTFTLSGTVTGFFTPANGK